MKLFTKVQEQIEDAYRRMDQEARYRPAAPSDGFGNIPFPLEELDIDEEATRYAHAWHSDEDRGAYWIGSCDFAARPATIFAIEAARLMCGLGREPALRLLRMAVAELERIGPSGMERLGG
jgi:hypothetical protein